MSTTKSTKTTTPAENLEVFFGDAETVSPYQLAKITNTVLAAAGLNKELPPQMFYTYAKKGMFGNEKGTKVITKAQGIAWIIKYVGKLTK